MVCPNCTTLNSPAAQYCASCGVPLNPLVLAEGTVLNERYCLGSVLGQGGFGITYEADDSMLGRNVAVKELVPSGATRHGVSLHLRTTPQGNDFGRLKKAFLKEGRLLAQFKHAHIVRVLDLFEANGTAYIVMEYLTGELLKASIERNGSLDPASVVRYAAQVLAGLSVVHSVKLLHRDLKPDNLVITPDDQVVMIDFGSARNFASKTLQHTRLVTPGYAPPEQYSTQARFGPYTDLYALGATLYHALAGAPPPPSTDRLMGTPLPPLPSKVPTQLRDVVMKALELPADKRFQSAEEMKKGLEALITPSPEPSSTAVTTMLPQPTPQPTPQPMPPTVSPTPHRPIPRPTPSRRTLSRAPSRTPSRTPRRTPQNNPRAVFMLLLGVVLTVGAWQAWTQNVPQWRVALASWLQGTPPPSATSVLPQTSLASSPPAAPSNATTPAIVSPAQTSPQPPSSTPSAQMSDVPPPPTALSSAPSATTSAASPETPSLPPPPEPAPISDEELLIMADVYLQRGQNPNLYDALKLYADSVVFYGEGLVGKAFIAEDKQNYFARWPSRVFRRDSPLLFLETTPQSRTVRFDYTFVVTNDQQREVSGTAFVELTFKRSGDRLLITREQGEVY